MKDRAAWRAWLSANHDRETPVWLACAKKHSGAESVSYEEAVEEAICFGWIDGQLKSVGPDRFLLRFSPRRPGSRWSAANIARAERMIHAGLMTGQGRRVYENAMQEGRVVPAIDTFMVPAELEEALAINAPAAENFRNLSPTHRRMFALYVDQARREETRKKRVDVSIRLLEENRKLTDVFGIRKKP
jgi:uncharacterized protein YdeI (YjbR/CyaY-like superfamily)